MTKMIVHVGRSLSVLVVAAALALFSSGCGTPSGSGNGPKVDVGAQTNAAVAMPQGSIELIRVGDKVEITFSDLPEVYPPMAQRVREDGTITLPLGVTVTAAGKKAGELQDAIRVLYVPKYFHRLTVSVKLEERVIYVGGQVRRPDRYVYAGEMTVLGAIKVAGDFTEFSKKTEVVVTRADNTRIVVDCKKALKDAKYDLPIFPGDRIHVPQRIWW